MFEFIIFLDLLEKTNLMEKLDEMKDFTLLLPSSKAMNEVDFIDLQSKRQLDEQIDRKKNIYKI